MDSGLLVFSVVISETHDPMCEDFIEDNDFEWGLFFLR